MFDTQGTPRDALVDEVRARLAEFDAIASTAGCGEAYLTGVCEGLDAFDRGGPARHPPAHHRPVPLNLT